MNSKIPAHATCVFSGVTHDIYQWQQELYNGTTATFEIVKRRDSAVVLALDADNNVFYAEQEQPNRQPFLSLFGGQAERGEDALTAAKREFLEETGMISDAWELLMTHDIPGRMEWHIYVYIARGCRKIADQQLDGGEKITVKSLPIDDFLEKIVTDPRFVELELRHVVLSAFNPEKTAELKAQIIG